jgi:hypothetical protein
MHFLLPLLFALTFARHQYDPGFPASASYPQNFTGPVSLRYGMLLALKMFRRLLLGSAYGVLNVFGTFAFNYNVMNQPGRNAKFQVLVFDRRNFYIYQNDTFAPTCLNAQTCTTISTLPRSGQVSMCFIIASFLCYSFVPLFMLCLFESFQFIHDDLSHSLGRVHSQTDDIWLVVRNRNLVDNANLQVTFAAYRTGK